MEHEHGIIIGVRSGQGFSVLDDHQKHELSSSKLRSSGRSARRAISVASKVDRNLLSEQEKAEFDLNTFRAAAIAATAQMRKGLDLPKF
jgi:hypothetical protein